MAPELLPAFAVLALVGGEHLAALSYLGVEVIALNVPEQPRLVPERRLGGTSRPQSAFSCCRGNIPGLVCASMETGQSSSRDERRWFTATEAAHYIGVHIDTLYSYTRLRKNKPPYVKLGNDRRYRFPKDRFIEWANGAQKQG